MTLSLPRMMRGSLAAGASDLAPESVAGKEFAEPATAPAAIPGELSGWIGRPSVSPPTDTSDALVGVAKYAAG